MAAASPQARRQASPIRLAEAEAEATKMVSDAIANGNLNALNYFVANKYVEALKEMAHSPNQKMLLLPMEATGIIGSLAGIAELAKESLSQQGAGKAVPPPR
jgi:regulator of protease activity HflC (stomatin/prohibitin superfamily)